MRILILLHLLLGSAIALSAQNFSDSIAMHRATYKQEFLTDKRSPVTAQDFQYLDFYKPNKNYRVLAKFQKVIDTIGFEMQTHSGKIKKYFVYGHLQFSLHHKKQKLFIYQSKDLMQQAEFENYLFLPFTDFTTNNSTYGGGRYLDFKIIDISNNNLIIDFNKCYNPYCAFGKGFHCPIPPTENRMKIKIEAGEKMYKKKLE
jgi:uncharacterized protein